MTSSATRTVCLSAILILLAAAVPARLPDAALKKAQEAERQLKANQPREAIATLELLDREHPSEPAVNLRLAQMYDGLGEDGPALFYYRRYAKLVGDRARDEATARLTTLEAVAGARSGADAYGKKLGERSSAMGTPVPRIIERNLVKIDPEGKESPLKPSDVGLPESMDKKVVRPTPEATPLPDRTPSPILKFPDPKRTQPGIPAGKTPEPVAAFTPPPFSGDPERDTAKKLVSETVAGQAASDVVVGPGREASGTPTRTVISDSGVAPAGRTIAPPVIGRPGTRTVPPASPADDSLSRAIQPGTVAPVAPAAATRTRNQGAAKFFTVSPADSAEAVVKLTNGVPNSVLAFNAVPDSDGEPVNALLTTGESRTLRLPPGGYHVIVNMTNNNYPPATLLDSKFDFQFQSGRQYVRRITEDTLQQPIR